MNKNRKILNNAAAGGLAGAVGGLFGGGGGMVAVPLLKNCLGYGEKRAHATAIAIIAPICAAAAITYIIAGFYRAQIVIPAAIGSFAGGFLGAGLLGLLPEYVINAVFTALMLIAGARLLF